MARILVVDDSAQNLALLELYLRGSEFEVTTAGGGHEALELCLQQQFELILLDVLMPGVDGFEVCRRLKNDPRTAFVPVIFLTARLGDESDRVAAYRLGAVDYLQKPVNREELLARIRVMLSLEQARSRLDRENAALRRQLEHQARELAAAQQQLLDLQWLRDAARTAAPPAVVRVDAGGRVVAVAGQPPEWFAPLAVGEPLAAAGPLGAELQAALRDGRAAVAVDAATAAQPERRWAVEVVAAPGQAGALLLLRDATASSEVERRLRAREAAAPPAPAARADDGRYAITDFVGSAPSVQALTAMVDRLRQSRSTVLIQGESGTGKELVARALHFDGSHRSAPFVPLHCGAIAPELIESELFGHEKGAFTGAQQTRDGLFRAADGGTIFLDEIAETSLDVQVKLLRVLQRGEIRPVGSNQPRIVDVRILAATNRDLLQMVREGTFREDLYYRLEVVRLELPALRERLADLPALVEHFLGVGNRKHGRADRPVRGVSRGALARLQAYPWPGNVRELENVIERAFALGIGELLQEEDLPERVRRGQPELLPQPVQRPRGPVAAVRPRRQVRDDAERQAIEQALLDLDGDKAAVARRLGMARSTFYRRLRELGL